MPRTKQIVGLDIGARNVRAVWMRLESGAPRAFRVETLALPIETQDSIPIVRSWLAKIGLANAFCSVSLPGASAVFQPGRIPPNDPRTPRQAAAMDLAQFNEMAGDTMRHALHAFSAPGEPGHTYYLLSMARPVAIERALESAALLGVRPADLIPAPVALFNALEPLAPTHAQPWLYLDVGHQQTDAAIGLPSRLLFARTIPIGGRAFTDAIAQSASLSLVQAETRKQSDTDIASEPAGSPLRAVADRWVSQIQSCLGVYRGQYGAGAFAVDRVVLTGGGSRLRGLADALSTQLQMPVMPATDLPGAGASQWLGTCDLAAGLAVSALEATPVQLSLLPEKLRDEIVFKEKKPYWVAAAIFGALALGLFTASGLASLHRDRKNLEQERAELRGCETIVKQMDEIRHNGEAIRARAAPLLPILMGGPVARDTLSLVARNIHPDDWITLFCDEASYLPLAPQTDPPKPLPRRSPFALFRDLTTGKLPTSQPASLPNRLPAKSVRPVFIFEGYTPDPSLATVKDLLARLRASAGVVKTDLLADDRVLPPKGLTEAERAALPPFRRFVIQLEVAPQ